MDVEPAIQKLRYDGVDTELLTTVTDASAKLPSRAQLEIDFGRLPAETWKQIATALRMAVSVLGLSNLVRNLVPRRSKPVLRRKNQDSDQGRDDSGRDGQRAPGSEPDYAVTASGGFQEEEMADWQVALWEELPWRQR